MQSFGNRLWHGLSQEVRETDREPLRIEPEARGGSPAGAEERWVIPTRYKQQSTKKTGKKPDSSLVDIFLNLELKIKFSVFSKRNLVSVAFDLERWPCSETWLTQDAHLSTTLPRFHVCYHKSIHSDQVDDTMISAKWNYIIVKSVAGTYTLLQSSCLYSNPSFMSCVPSSVTRISSIFAKR